MQTALLLLFFVAMTFGHFAKIGWLPNPAPFLFEILCAVMLVYVLAAGVRDQFRFVNPRYWVVFGSIVVIMVCGIVINNVAPGPIVAGLRNYARAIPLFFVPAVFFFTERQLQTQLRFLLGLAILQIPFAIMQRLATRARGGITGDETVGTFSSSSYVSIFLIGAICVLVALYLKRRIRAAHLVALFLLLIIPTTINETKATFVFLPIAILMVFLTLAPPGRRAKNVLLASLLLVVFAAVFIPIYDHLIQDRPHPISLLDFFTKEGALEDYLGKNADVGVSGQKEAGRLDSVIVPLRVLSEDIPQLAFGYGIGNASNSALGPQFTGQYHAIFQFFLVTLGARLILEIGVLGCGLVMLLYWMIYRDSRVVATGSNSTISAVAAAWTGFVPVIFLSSYYKDILTSDALSCLFWYFSGVIAAERMRLISEKARAPASSGAGLRSSGPKFELRNTLG